MFQKDGGSGGLDEGDAEFVAEDVEMLGDLGQGGLGAKEGELEGGGGMGRRGSCKRRF